MAGAVSVLEVVESLPRDAIGIVRFDDHGSVLVDSGVICWAAARGAPQRLTDLLRMQRNPPIERGYLARVLRDCRDQRKPLGETLLATGQITEEGLRTALSSLVIEAIASIAQARRVEPHFESLADVHYDRRFVFSPAEVLAGLGERRNRALAVVARRHLSGALVARLPGFAFVRAAAATEPVVIAAPRDNPCAVKDVLELGRRCSGLLSSGGSDADVVVARWHESQCLLAWEHRRVAFAVMCADNDVRLLASRLNAARKLAAGRA